MREYKRALRVATALTVLSVVAATSSTLAWLQTRRSLSISFSDATVRTGDTDLEVNFKHSFNTMTSEKESFSVLRLSTNTSVTDISGDGVNFYQPMWSGTPNTIENGGDGKSEYLVSQINDVTPRKPGTNSPGDPGLGSDKILIDFTLTLSRDENADVGMYVFLGEDTSLYHVSGDTSVLNVLSALRMAVINYDDDDMITGAPSTTILYAPVSEPNPTYLVEGGSGAYGSVGFSFADSNDVNLRSDPFETIPEYDDAILLYPPVADLTTLTGSDSVDVTFRIWIEGTDKDALAPVVHQEFGLMLDLYVISSE